MDITEVRIFPTESKDGKLKAFATMTFDDWFVVRNVKVIQGNNGLFVAMPSRKAMDACQKCQFKNVVGSRFCNQCGAQIVQKTLTEEEAREQHGNHMDIAHPITQDCRVYIQEKILSAYNSELGKSSSAPKPEKPAAPKPETPAAPVEAPPVEEKTEEIEKPKAAPVEEPPVSSPETSPETSPEVTEGKDIEL